MLIMSLLAPSSSTLLFIILSNITLNQSFLLATLPLTSGSKSSFSFYSTSTQAFSESNMTSENKSTSKDTAATVVSTPEQSALAYNKFFSAAVDITDAFFDEETNVLSVVRSVRDVDCNQRRKFLYHIPITSDTSSGAYENDGKPKEITSPIPPVELPCKVAIRIPSPSGEKVALLLNEDVVIECGDSKTSSTSKRQVFEIWGERGTCLERRVALPKDLHGKVCCDVSWFGGISWNEQEDALVYVAEQESPKTSSFFARTAGDSGSKEGEVQVGAQYTLGIGKKEDWGEKYTSTALLRMFCVSLKTGKCGLVENCPGGVNGSNSGGSFTFGQPLFSPCGETIVYVGWDAGGGGNMPKRLGSIYCMQRHSKLYTSSIKNLIENLHQKKNNVKASGKDEGFICITEDHRMACSPRFSRSVNGSSRLAFLGSTKGFDTHSGNVGLYIVDWKEDEGLVIDSLQNLVNECAGPDEIYNNDNNWLVKGCGFSFPGIFSTSLPQNCFAENSSYILVSTVWGSTKRILKVSLEDGSIDPLVFVTTPSSKEEELKAIQCSQSILCVTNKDVFFIQSSPSKPGIIMKASIKDKSSSIVSSFSPISITNHSPVSRLKNEIEWRVMQLNPDDGTNDVIQSILLLPSGTSMDCLPPLIVVPHGGPHSSLTTSYIPSYAFLCSHGKYAILEVNYRGSVGFGQKNIESLTGNIGKQDVSDCVQATKAAIETGLVDGNRVGICGG